MRKRGKRRRDSYVVRGSMRDQHHAVALSSRKQRELETRCRSLKSNDCVIVFQTAVIDLMRYHLRLSKDQALTKLLNLLSKTELDERRNKPTFLKIKKKPLTLIISKSTSWREKKHIIYISLKPNYTVSSTDEILEKLASQAIIDALGE